MEPSTSWPARSPEHDVVYEGPETKSQLLIRTTCHTFSQFADPVNGSIVARNPEGREHVAQKVEGTTNRYVILDLPDDTYTVEISSDVHEPWSQSGVEPGDVVSAQLTGNAAVALTVTDAETGEPIDAYSVAVQFENAPFRPNRVALRETRDALPAGNLYTGLIPHECTLFVDAEGYAPAEAPLGMLQPNESRDVAIALTRGASLAVQVLHTNGAPAAGAEVLLHPTWPLYDPMDVLSGPTEMSEKTAFESNTVRGKADAEGRFIANGVPAIIYDAQARIGLASARADGLQAIDGETINARIELPAMGTLVGTVRWKGDAPFDGLRALVFPKGTTRRRHVGRGHRIESSALDEQGVFRIEGVPAGPHVVELYRPPSSLPFGSTGSIRTNPTYVVLGEVEIAGGQETRRTFDAAGHSPGAITVTATVNGSPAAGAVVVCEYTGNASDTGGVIGSDGILVLEPVFPGSVQLSIRHANFAWSVDASEPIEIEPGARIAHTFDVETARGRLRILDAATGEPAGSKQIEMGINHSAKTDADGWLDVELQIGTRYFAAAGRWEEFGESAAGQARVALDWGPEGPIVESIRVEFE